MRIAVVWLMVAACSGDRPANRPIRFLHTFAPDETELFNATMAERGIVVDSSLVPFARGQQVISEILHAGTNCPDLIRIDSTWLALLEGDGHQLLPASAELRALDWLAEPPDKGIPQTIDGLVVVRDSAAPAPASSSITDLVAAARAARHDERKFPLGVRVDGYWFVPWLRAYNSDLVPSDGPARARPDIGAAGAVDAMIAFSSLFGDIAALPPPAGSEAPEELRRWTSHDVAYWVTGPWQIGALRDRERLAVSPLSHAPRGGQMLVVPACAKNPEAGWRLAAELVSVPVATRFAEAFATVPVRASSLAASPQLVKAIYDALHDAGPLPPDSITPLLFDDLNPALRAVIEHDAEAGEAIEGVRRGWQRLKQRSAR